MRANLHSEPEELVRHTAAHDRHRGCPRPTCRAVLLHHTPHRRRNEQGNNNAGMAGAATSSARELDINKGWSGMDNKEEARNTKLRQSMLWAGRHPLPLDRYNTSNHGQQLPPLRFAKWDTGIAVAEESCANAGIPARIHWAVPYWTPKKIRTGQGDDSGPEFQATHGVPIALAHALKHSNNPHRYRNGGNRQRQSATHQYMRHKTTPTR